MIEFRNPYSIAPPGSCKEILSHPTDKSGSIELALFQEHRYAFFYWLKWTRSMRTAQPPCLVSLDWHQDLCFPCRKEKEWLTELNQDDNGEVAVFSWAKLAGNNDGHVLAAAYLNIIGNIYVHCRQGKFESSWEDESITDVHGNIHLIKKFRTAESLQAYLLKSNEVKTYFDIDLDYFTLNNPYNGIGKRFTYMSEKEIRKLLSVDTPLMQWIFDRLAGFTIATEPKHCGGLLKSNKLLDIINKNYFSPGLFSPESDWKHKA